MTKILDIYGRRARVTLFWEYARRAAARYEIFEIYARASARYADLGIYAGGALRYVYYFCGVAVSSRRGPPCPAAKSTAGAASVTSRETPDTATMLSKLAVYGDDEHPPKKAKMNDARAADAEADAMEIAVRRFEQVHLPLATARAEVASFHAALLLLLCLGEICRFHPPKTRRLRERKSADSPERPTKKYF